jgi:hypothetical protein
MISHSVEDRIEKQESVRVLYPCESGTRRGDSSLKTAMIMSVSFLSDRPGGTSRS